MVRAAAGNCDAEESEQKPEAHGVATNDPSSATRPTKAFDSNLDAMAGLAAAH